MQYSGLAQQQCDKQPTYSTVPIEKRVDSLKLNMGQSRS